MPTTAEIIHRALSAAASSGVTVQAREDLDALRNECGYSDDDDCSVDSLIEYKNALEDLIGTLQAQQPGCAEQIAAAIANGVATVLEDLHALLFPEQHPGYDRAHRFWADKTDEEIDSFADRKARETELYAPVAALCREGRHDDARRLHSSLSAQFEAIGDVDVFQWDSETIEILAARISRLRSELRP